MTKNLLLLVILLALFSLETSQAELNLPISDVLFCKLSLSMKRLEEALSFFQTPYEDKFILWKRTVLTKRYLNELSYQMNKYNNVILGSGNKANGDKNVIVGNYNNIQGSNNWVFISKFTGRINGDLLISHWRVEIDKVDQILIDARHAISFLDESKNTKPVERKVDVHKNRRVCKWGQWANPQQPETYGLWNRYYGFDDYAKQYGNHHQSWKKSKGCFLKNLFSWGKRSLRKEDESSSRKSHRREEESSSSNKRRGCRRNRWGYRRH